MIPELPHAISFSGGKSSGRMLRLLMDTHSDFDKRFMVLFCNTGKEHDATLDFVHDVETRWGINIHWLEYCRIPSRDLSENWFRAGRKRSNLKKAQEKDEYAHWWREVNYLTASRRTDTNTPFDVLLEWANQLPNVQTRQCSVQMKLRTMQRFLGYHGIFEFNSYIGMRADEAHREMEVLVNIEKGEHPNFPLIRAGIHKSNVEEFWKNHPFTLRIPELLGNCDLCFLKKRWKRVAIAKMDPSAAIWWRDKEDVFAKKCVGAGAFFRKGESYQGVINDAAHPQLALDDQEEDNPCGCAAGGYRAFGDKDEI